MTPPLESLSDSALSEAVAIEVAGWTPLFTLMKRGYYYRVDAKGYTASLEEAWKVNEQVANEHVDQCKQNPVTKHAIPFPDFATSADAVISLLQRRHTTATYCTVTDMWYIETFNYSRTGKGMAETFAKASCIALLKAARANKK